MIQESDRNRALGAGIAGRAEIEDVRLMRSSFDLVKIPDGEHRLGWTLDVRPGTEFEPGAEHFIVKCDYTLVVKEAAKGGEAEGALVTSIEFTMAALYELETTDADSTSSEEEIAAFGASTGAFALYPYARAYVQDVTSRLGLPPLTLGVYRIPISDPADALPKDPERSDGAPVHSTRRRSAKA
jgi:hypothetical protein